MKLVRAQIRDFRSIETADIILERINFLFGDNRRGKSSTLKAFGACLMASAPDSVIRHGEKSAEVVLTIQACGREHTVAYKRYRSQTTKPAVNGVQVPMKVYLDAMKDNFGVSHRVAGAIIDSRSFMRMNSKDQVGVILAAGDVTFGWAEADAEFRAWCGRHQTQEVPLNTVVNTILSMHGVALIEHIQKTAYAQRTELNRILKEEASEPTPDARIIQYIRDPRLLDELRREKTALAANISTLQGKLSTFVELERLGDPDKALQGFGTEDLRKKADKYRADVAASMEAGQVVASLGQTAASLESARRTLNDRTCPFGVRCNYKDDKSAWDEFVASVDAASAAFRKAKAEAPEPPNPAIAQMLEQKRREHAALMGQREQKRLLMTNVAPEGAEQVALALETASARLNQVDELLGLIRAHQGAMAEFARSSASRASTQIRRDNLDNVVKAFDKEIRAEVFRDDQGSFQKHFNEALGYFFDNIRVSVSSEIDFSMTLTLNGHPVSFDDMSESEQLLVSMAAQHAIAQIGKAGLLFVDAADLLQGELRNRFVRGLYRIAEGYETVVVASTIGSVDIRQSPLRNAPGTKVFVVGEATGPDGTTYGYPGCVAAL